jgi:hypothetical protein
MSSNTPETTPRPEAGSPDARYGRQHVLDNRLSAMFQDSPHSMASSYSFDAKERVERDAMGNGGEMW